MGYIENATYKCERPSGENASECLSLIVESPEILKMIVSDQEGIMLQRIVSFGDYMQAKNSMAKLYII